MADVAEDAPPPSAADAAVQPAKVVVLFKATGDAPILKQNKFKARFPRDRTPLQRLLTCAAPRRTAQISASERFGKVVDFLRKQIQRDSVVRRRRRRLAASCLVRASAHAGPVRASSFILRALSRRTWTTRSPRCTRRARAASGARARLACAVHVPRVSRCTLKRAPPRRSPSPKTASSCCTTLPRPPGAE